MLESSRVVVIGSCVRGFEGFLFFFLFMGSKVSTVNVCGVKSVPFWIISTLARWKVTYGGMVWDLDGFSIF